MTEIYECTGCGATFKEGQVKPIFQCSITHRAPYRGSGHFIDCPRCGKFEGVKDLRMPPPIPVPDGDRPPPLKQPLYDTSTIETQGPSFSTLFHGPKKEEERAPRRGISTGMATVLGMVAALAPEPLPTSARIAGQEQCTSCGQVEEHATDCRPPRGFRKVT